MDMSAITAAGVSTAPPPGLHMAYGVISAAEEAALIALIESLELPRVALDPLNPRSSRAYGWNYLQDDTIEPCPGLPPGFDELTKRAAALVGVAPDDLVQGMLIRYEPQSIIQWHLDKAVWDHVIGISLGESVTMGFRKEQAGGDDIRAVELPPRSAYVMTGEARFDYKHGLPPAPGTRWSVTFRSFSAEGQRQREQALSRRQDREG